MTWETYHTQSERYAISAELAGKARDFVHAKQLYELAAAQEESALAALDPQETRGLGIFAVSACALWYKAGAYDRAKELALSQLRTNLLPPFAEDQLRELLAEVERTTELLAAMKEWQASLSLSPADRDRLAKAVQEWKTATAEAAPVYQATA